MRLVPSDLYKLTTTVDALTELTSQHGIVVEATVNLSSGSTAKFTYEGATEEYEIEVAE